jgi:hypothetical protein
MVNQDIKRGHYSHIEGDGLKDMLRKLFDTEPEDGDGGWVHIRYGALQPLSVKVLSKAELAVETKSAADVSADVAQETIRRYNKFLETATGFNSKQRSKRLQQKAKKGKL